jgi:carboxymethylenebutenolidase
MSKISHPMRGLMLAITALPLLLSGCGGDDPGATAADKKAGRANVEAMSREHADDTSEPSAGAKFEPRRPVVAERLPYAEVDDELVYGHFAFPEDMIEPLPAVIIIHEWWGLNDNIRSVAERLAGEGYIVLAIDLFGGNVADNPEAAKALMASVVENPGPANENIRQAYDFVSTTAGAPKTGSLGWCFGGGWSLNTAMLFPDDLDAVVIYYGQVTDDEDRLHDISAPILGLFGGKDRGIPVDSVKRFEAALERLRKQYEIHIYPDARHAFANPTGRAYDAEVADDAWRRTLEFLGTHLGAGDEAS